MSKTVSPQIIETMKTYYQERAGEYDDWFYRRGPFDRGEEINARWFMEVDEIGAALERLQLSGDVLELAPGTGIWTERFARTARTVTAVDASAEMIKINRAKVASKRVSYVQSDLFQWQPERTYDAVCFCFWLSHVPLERLDAFLGMVAQVARPGCKIFFADSGRNALGSTLTRSLPEEEQQVETRKLQDGRTFQVVKNYYDPAFLMPHFELAGLDTTIQETPNKYFLYGYGIRR
jgi:demethylmenaquinone methyltransferase/2-methoxy-6-polyprenyl-1,4-benzoquinol methylase